jgi:uncharacterized membrane protein YgcG
MKTFKRLSAITLVTLSPVFVLLSFPLPAHAQANGAMQFDQSMGPWIGAWTIIDDRIADRESDRGPRTDVETQPTPDGMGLEIVPSDRAESRDKDRGEKVTIEIRATPDGKGIEITRKSAKQPDVTEVLTLDGSKKQVNAENCSGWQSARLIREAGVIATSSEITCKGTGSFATSDLKMFLAADQMVDILAIKAGEQTRLAVRRMEFERDLASQESRQSLPATAARTALSAPWNLETVIELSASIDSSVLEAALIEKHTYLKLTSKSLKQLKQANVPESIIDLLVAISLPDKFQIRKNGQVELRPLTVVSSSDNLRMYYPFDYGYWPGSFFNCFSLYGYYGIGSYGGMLPGACYSYYSPLWWDYPIYFPGNPIPPDGSGGGGAAGASARVTANRGYVQIDPIGSGRHAVPRHGYSPQFGHPESSSSQGSSASSGGGSAVSSGGSSGGYSSGSSGGYSGGGGGGGGSSASPGGYSSGGGGGGQATPR